MVHIDYLDDGTKVLVSDERIETYTLTRDGDKYPTKYAVRITDEMITVIKQHPYDLSA